MVPCLVFRISKSSSVGFLKDLVYFLKLVDVLRGFCKSFNIFRGIGKVLDLQMSRSLLIFSNFPRKGKISKNRTKPSGNLDRKDLPIPIVSSGNL